MQNTLQSRPSRSFIFWGLTTLTLFWASFVSGTGLRLHGEFFMRGGFSNLEVVMNTQKGYQFSANTMKFSMLIVASFLLLAASMASLILRKYKAAKVTLMASIGMYVVFLIWGHFGPYSAFQGTSLNLSSGDLQGLLIYVVVFGALFRYIYKYQNLETKA